MSVQRFRYVARRAPGQSEEGVVSAESVEAVSRILASRGLFAEEVTPIDASERARFRWRLGRKQWSLSEQSLFARQLADLLSGGLSVDGALAILREQARDPKTVAILAGLHASVREGKPFSEALAEKESHFPTTLVAAVEAGEASGALAEVLESVADLLEQEDSVLRKVREALLYPSLVAFVSLLTVVVLFTFVIPKVAVLYSDLEQILPLPTRLLLGLSDSFTSSGWIVALGLLLAGALLHRETRRSEAVRATVARALFRIPVVGRILWLREQVRLCRILGTLAEGGVPVLNALAQCGRAAGNAYYGQRLVAMSREVRDGKRLSEAFRAEPLFEGSLTAMTRVGEESGDLPGALHKAGRLFERELDGSLRRSTTLLEPLLILGLGFMVAFVVFAMMLPILQMDLGVR